jgi:putative membrane protein
MKKSTIKKIAILGLILTILPIIIIIPIAFAIYNFNDSNGFTAICSLTFWIGIILLIVSGILYFTNKQSLSDSKGHAQKIIYERYAKGEITKEELEEMKKDIEK